MAINLQAILTLQDRATKPLMQVNRTIERVDRATNNYSRSMDKASNSGVSGFGRAVTAVGGLATAIGGAIGVSKILEATLSGAMQMETDKLTLKALVNDAGKANKLFDMLQKKGMSSVFSDADFMNAGKAFLPITKDLGEINKLLGVTERLGSSNKLEGMQGASIAIREALSSDYVSLQERFNIPKSMIKNAFAGADTATEKIAALDSVLNKMGYTQKFVNDVNKSSAAQWDMLKSNVTTAMAQMGIAALDKLKKPLSELNAWMSSGGLTWLKEKGSDFLSDAATKVVKFGNYIKTNWPTIQQNFSKFVSITKSLKEPLIAAGVAVVAFKGIMTGLTIISTINTLVKAYRAGTLLATIAQWNLNAALLANPIAWVVAGIVGLIAVGVLLYRNWEKVEAVWSSVWKSIKQNAADSVNSVIGKINALIGTINKIPGVNIPIIPKVNWGATEVAPSKKLSKSNPQLGSMVNYAPKNYGGLNFGGNGHKGGISRVPYDGYHIRAHEGERVLTKEQNDAYNAGNGGSGVSITIQSMTVRQDNDIEAIASALAEKVHSARERGA